MKALQWIYTRIGTLFTRRKGNDPGELYPDIIVDQGPESILQKLKELDLRVTEILEFLRSNNKFQVSLKNIDSAQDLPLYKECSLTELNNHFYQVESLMKIYCTLPQLKWLPPTRGWAASPDFLAKVLEIVIKQEPVSVLEAGSGVSTIVVGLGLLLNKTGSLISLENDNTFHSLTCENIVINKIEKFVEVIHCPLDQYSLSGSMFSWYNIEKVTFNKPFDLIVVDGPPGSTCPLARFPIVPLLHQHFAHKTTIILDDWKRPDEKTIVNKWMDFLIENDFQVSLLEYGSCEKGMAILEVLRIVRENPG